MLYMKEMRPKVVAECTLKESAAINQILGRKVSNFENGKSSLRASHTWDFDGGSTLKKKSFLAVARSDKGGTG